MLIIEIALGIVLAIFILSLISEIIAVGLIVIGLALILLVLYLAYIYLGTNIFYLLPFVSLFFITEKLLQYRERNGKKIDAENDMENEAGLFKLQKIKDNQWIDAGFNRIEYVKVLDEYKRRIGMNPYDSNALRIIRLSKNNDFIVCSLQQDSEKSFYKKLFRKNI